MEIELKRLSAPHSLTEAIEGATTTEERVSRVLTYLAACFLVAMIKYPSRDATTALNDLELYLRERR